MACPHVSDAAALVSQTNPNMKPTAVLQELQGTAATNYVSGLYSTDTNRLLNVAASGCVRVACGAQGANRMRTAIRVAMAFPLLGSSIVGLMRAGRVGVGYEFAEAGAGRGLALRSSRRIGCAPQSRWPWHFR